MNTQRRETTYIVRIWQEPSELAAPGEWRGVLRSPDGRRQWFFKSAEELWDLLTRGEAPAETERGKPQASRYREGKDSPDRRFTTPGFRRP